MRWCSLTKARVEQNQKQITETAVLHHPLTLKPIYILSDSQLLFWREGGVLFLDSVLKKTESNCPRAAYIGASNGDDPIAFSIFEAAMDGIGLQQRRLIPSAFSVDDESFLNVAEIILLAGGDVEGGLSVLNNNGLREIIIRRYFEGALLIGVSAGAVQLGLPGRTKDNRSSEVPPDFFRLVQCIIGVHEPADRWEGLRRAVYAAGVNVRGIGIPAGGGAIYHPDDSLEPIRTSLNEFLLEGDNMIHNVLFPGSHTKVQKAAEISQSNDISR